MVSIIFGKTNKPVFQIIVIVLRFFVELILLKQKFIRYMTDNQGAIEVSRNWLIYDSVELSLPSAYVNEVRAFGIPTHVIFYLQ